jgi:hypothetical protein
MNLPPRSTARFADQKRNKGVLGTCGEHLRKTLIKQLQKKDLLPFAQVWTVTAAFVLESHSFKHCENSAIPVKNQTRPDWAVPFWAATSEGFAAFAQCKETATGKWTSVEKKGPVWGLYSSYASTHRECCRVMPRLILRGLDREG